MDDDLRQKTLKLSTSQMEKLAKVCMRYPNVEMEFTTDQPSYADDSFAELDVIVKRPDFEEEDELAIFNEAPYT